MYYPLCNINKYYICIYIYSYMYVVVNGTDSIGALNSVAVRKVLKSVNGTGCGTEWWRYRFRLTVRDGCGTELIWFNGTKLPTLFVA